MVAPRWLLIVVLLLSSGVQASWREALPNAQVVGSGELTLFGFRIYTARLFSPATPFTVNSPMALELTYHRDIDRQDLVDASIDEIKRISGKSVTAEQLEAWRQQMSQAFVDVQPGMKITGVYLPGREARFYVGEKLQHVVPDSAFAKAFFDIWLDPKTRNPELRERLLGKAQS
ncbi:chalcone isomerase family protein [Pseudomonas viridiflava]|uniref:chalcone isomerase family protein n=1 Tax=Pseudomonas viridiflava TaxID=33069 RepID=UPI002EADFABA|nr:chalcone isomerase family protein [Pseudomonas viridiflava]MEE3971721.1 chalcone isomerase family protein [Pseudomonas viridiflava]MEE4018399.1 chalcone isomerase family protein [Pseudomonas viridiflava]MEE4045195.1 chalcone isomerase family protein [Pseudomonas viridiflava]